MDDNQVQDKDTEDEIDDANINITIKKPSTRTVNPSSKYISYYETLNANNIDTRYLTQLIMININYYL